MSLVYTNVKSPGNGSITRINTEQTYTGRKHSSGKAACSHKTQTKPNQTKLNQINPTQPNPKQTKPNQLSYNKKPKPTHFQSSRSLV